MPGARRKTLLFAGSVDAWTYCSSEALLEDGEGMPGFFSVLSQGERGHRKRFDEWMGYVAQAIVNIRSVIAGDVIIGGEAAQYLDDDMLTELKHRAESLSPFTTDFTLKKSICIEDQNTIGAALRFVRDYVDGICGRMRPLPRR